MPIAQACLVNCVRGVGSQNFAGPRHRQARGAGGILLVVYLTIELAGAYVTMNLVVAGRCSTVRREFEARIEAKPWIR